MDESSSTGVAVQPSRVVVRIWDLDETLIIFSSLLEGSCVFGGTAFHSRKDSIKTISKQIATARGKDAKAYELYVKFLDSGKRGSGGA